MTRLLDIKNLHVQYNTDDAIVYALNGVNLTINKGETVGLVGETGAGKTTLAKIFARAINCQNLLDGEVCGKCEACQMSQGGVSPNIIEIDAASNNSVDNIRDLRDEIRHAPISGKYKVLIIDEVHMLSTGAFNALLKTLEEPPAHVFFILATTEAHKIPVTILSRCQRFDLKRINQRDMTVALRKYMDGEGIAITDEALSYTAELSDGAMRDALSILDRAATLGNDSSITLEAMRELTGAADEGTAFRLTEALQALDSRACLDIIEEIVMNGRDVTQFIQEYVRHLRDLMIVGSLGERGAQLGYSQDRLGKLAKAARNPERVLHLLTCFVELSAGLRYSGNERISLEVACVRLCSPEIPVLQERVPSVSHGETLRPQAAAPIPAAAPKPQPQGTPQPAAPDDIKAAIKNLNAIADRLKMPAKAMLKNSSAKYTGDNCLTIATDDASLATLERSRAAIKAEIATMFKRDIEVVIVSAKKIAGGQANNKANDTKAACAEVFGENVVDYS